LVGLDQLRDQIADRYQLLQQIGKGGSGVVWRAQDLRLQREIAMKELLPPAGVDEPDRRRLQHGVLREARAAARLQHPGAVAVYDVVEDGERQFIVMELVEAPDLSQIVARHGPLDTFRTAALGLELLEVLQAAHESGIIHRDVKPGNVLVPLLGRCRLSDFGIASLIDDPSITATGMIKGTPNYMSPEQAMAGTMSAATDMWSLGATLYFAVEGHPPFDKGQPIATLTAIAIEDPQPFVRAGVLGPALKPLFSKDPADRPDHQALRRSLQSIAAMGPEIAIDQALRGFSPDPAAATPTEALPATPPEPGTVWVDLESRQNEARLAPPAVHQRTAVESLTPGGGGQAGESPGGVLGGRWISQDSAGLETTPEERIPGTPGAFQPPMVQQVHDIPAARPPPPKPRMPGRAVTPRTLSSRLNEHRRPIRRWVPAALVAALLVVIAGYLVVTLSGSNNTKGAPNPAPSSTPGQAAARPTTSQPRTPTAQGAIPAGWKSYTDPDTGFRLAYPSTWTVARNATLTDFRDPTSGTYLRIDHQSPPASTPDGPWYQLEPTFAATNPGYHRIDISRTTFHGYPAAIWEYTYRGGTQPLHAIDMGMIVGDHGFGFNFQTRDSDWGANQTLLNNLENSFQP
jgi:hypothetical protein